VHGLKQRIICDINTKTAKCYNHKQQFISRPLEKLIRAFK